MKTKGLTLSEAYNSGKPFRFQFWDFWVRHHKESMEIKVSEALTCAWEIELPERKVTISESEFDEAWYESAVAETKSVHDSYLNLKEKLFGKAGEQ